jgi:hypothetical protein
MQINYCCPFWGCEQDSADAFIEKVIAAGYDGIETNFPSDVHFIDQFIKHIEKLKMQNSGFGFIGQQVMGPENETVHAYIAKMENRLLEIAALAPAFINSHTGKDYFSFDDNCKVIEATLNISVKTGVRILHETHRGRFSFHAASLLPYLQKFPEMELVGDFSHFCTVSESMLQDQVDIIEQIIPHVSHIHARVGWEQGPQVNNPAAPEWENHFDIFATWWKKMVEVKQQQGWKQLTITPEFGPAPYMPAEPFTQKPLSSQWNNNLYMKEKLQTIFK